MKGTKLVRAAVARKPSPALVISVIALVFASTGGAYAVGSAQSSDSSQDKQIAKSVVKQSLHGVTIQPVSYHASSGGGTKTLFNGRGLKLTANCAGGDTNVVAHSTAHGSSLHSYAIDPDGDATFNEDHNAVTDHNFNTGKSDALLSGDTFDQQLNVTFETRSGKAVNGLISVDSGGENKSATCAAVGQMIIP